MYPSVLFPLSLASVAFATNWTISVGYDNALTFNPTSILADIDDVILFQL